MATTLTINPHAAAGGPARPAQKRFAPGAAARLSFAGVLRSERIKLLSLRSIRLTLLITVLMGVGLSALLAAVWSSEVGAEGFIAAGPAGYQSYLTLVATFTAPFLALIFGVLGVFSIANEYSSGMILSTLAAVPRRTPVLVAKVMVTAVTAAVTATVLVVSGLGIGVAVLPAAAAELGSSAVISSALGTVVYLVCIALIALGIATLLRATAGGVAAIVGLTFVLPLGLQMLAMTGWAWVSTAAAYLPSSLGATLSQGLGDVAPAGGPSFGGALVALLVWVAAALIPAGVVFRRRDAR